MVAAKDLPALIQLFDDDSVSVHRAVVAALKELGPELPKLIRDLPVPLEEGRLLEILDSVGGPISIPGAKGAARSGPSGQAQTEAEGEAQFSAGDLVFHQAYGYRGVVVGFDSRCHASEDWYSSNQTQPARDQAWYHVLVHDSEHITYVAESNLRVDSEASPIKHPLVEYFFEGFAEGKHARNDRPWPNPGQG